MNDRASAADLNRWQGRAIDALGILHREGAKRGLRPLMWDVSTHSTLAGTCDTFGDPDVIRAQFDGWVALVDEFHAQAVKTAETIHREARFTPLRRPWMPPLDEHGDERLRMAYEYLRADWPHAKNALDLTGLIIVATIRNGVEVSP